MWKKDSLSVTPADLLAKMMIAFGEKKVSKAKSGKS